LWVFPGIEAWIKMTSPKRHSTKREAAKHKNRRFVGEKDPRKVKTHLRIITADARYRVLRSLQLNEVHGLNKHPRE
jgi:hypothetical protein